MKYCKKMCMAKLFLRKRETLDFFAVNGQYLGLAEEFIF